MPLPLFALALGVFGIGTTEFAIVGLLPEISNGLSVSIARAGLLVTGYAVGVAIGGPILAILTNRMSRKSALLVLIGLFVVGNALAAVAPSYGLLMVARIVTSFCHGAFVGIASVVAVDIVPADRRATAIAVVWAGFSASSIIGVPAGTALGHAFGWRSTFWTIAILGLVAAVMIAGLLRETKSTERSKSRQRVQGPRTANRSSHTSAQCVCLRRNFRRLYLHCAHTFERHWHFPSGPALGAPCFRHRRYDRDVRRRTPR